MLAFQPASVLTSVMKKLEKFTDATITKPQRLMADLQEIRRTGIAIQREEWRLGVTGIGAPIFDGTGRVIAGLGITAPAARFTAKKCKELGPLVRRFALRASHQLGYTSAELPKVKAEDHGAVGLDS
jgi:IclR family transcriptional regulator, KDG regulon repressor